MWRLNTPQKCICCGNTQKSSLWQFFLQSYRQQDPNFHETGLHGRENLKDNIIAKVIF